MTDEFNTRECSLVDGHDVDLLHEEGIPKDNTANTTCTIKLSCISKPRI
jgi:hypothetical protein